MKSGDCHVQSFEGFCATLELGINGTHIHASEEPPPKYLSEFEFRHNWRHHPSGMLDKLMTAPRR